MIMKYKILNIFTLLLFLPLCVVAQRVAEVSATYTYEVSEDANITFGDAKRRCIELAKAAAIKAEVCELVSTGTIDSRMETDNSSSSSFWENTVAQAKGEWLSFLKAPSVNVECRDGKLFFTAEVKGKAREITQSRIDMKWEIMKDGSGKKIASSTFDNNERMYVKFRSPVDGYVAVYMMIIDDDETVCLLPYPRDPDGRFEVKGGRTYLFFDKEENPEAVHYRMKTKKSQENNIVVLIYSPHPFTKCNDITGDKLHPSSINTIEFQKWLLRCQREDHDLIVDKKWIKILPKTKQ